MFLFSFPKFELHLLRRKGFFRDCIFFSVLTLCCVYSTHFIFLFQEMTLSGQSFTYEKKNQVQSYENPIHNGSIIMIVTLICSDE